MHVMYAAVLCISIDMDGMGRATATAIEHWAMSMGT